MNRTDIGMEDTFIDRRQARRKRKFLDRRELMAGWLPALRNRTGRRRLVVVHLATLAAMVIAGILLGVAVIGDGGPEWLGLPWILFTLLLVSSWTMLSIVTDFLDAAPSSALDEYERERVDSLRSLSYQCFLWFGMIFGTVLVFFGTWLGQTRPDWAADVAYVAGLAFLVPFMAILSLPTVVIAWTMPDE